MMDEPLIQIDVVLTVKDYTRAIHWFLLRKSRYFIAIILVAPIFLFLFFTEKPLADNGLGIVVALVIPMLLMVIGFLVAPYFGAKRQLASNKLLQGTQRYTFSNEGVQVVAPTFNGSQTWEGIREAFETGSNFLLFISTNQLYIIPKRCFQGDEQIVVLRELLTRHLSSKAKLRS